MKNWQIKWKKTGILIMGVMLGTTLLAGCGGNANKPEGGTNKAVTGESQGPLKLSIMSLMYAEPPKADSDVQKAVEAYTNTKLDISWVPNSMYKDKVNVTIGSGELPKAMLVQNNKDSNILNAVRSGAFWEVGPYIDDYPNLSKMSKAVFDNIKVDGKIYGLYRARDLSTFGIIFRSDWLKNVGLSEPKTIDDLYAVLKAFTLDDPDKNGKQDTVGLTEDKAMEGFNVIASYMGAPNGWEVKDGKLSPDFLAPEYFEAMQFYKKLYDEGLIKQDFPVLNNQQKKDDINQGKAGLVISNMIDAAAYQASLTKTFPGADVDVVSRIQGPKGERTPGGQGYNSVFMFPKSSVKTEEELKQILGFFDKLSDQTMLDLLGWGSEGKHYKLENNKPVFIDQKLFDTEVGSSYLQLQVAKYTAKTPGLETPLMEKYAKMIRENEEIAVNNPSNPLVSDTMTTKGTEIRPIIEDARAKFILGKIDEAGWQKAIDDWRKAGGDKIIEEFSAHYAQIN
ncbi:extracellular solute-binding protein [Paenibacillus sp. GCM10012307]|uniref:Extracellular solute-binding protein n=1 Tax=Paenibacillus roseus TaxID=2798579 RepID=A0A934MRX4_9BACL|nr:extracellular solute-binding protein [Paenibacillus roseus]MBJ6362754.1 extracellular solute-binding protein [Paenibacillus roseus]